MKPSLAPPAAEASVRRGGPWRDRRGAVMVEYVILLAFVCIGMVASIVAWGPALIANYERSLGILLSPFP
jgi:Flp pilus assembly pilin Flp